MLDEYAEEFGTGLEKQEQHPHERVQALKHPQQPIYRQEQVAMAAQPLPQQPAMQQQIQAQTAPAQPQYNPPIYQQYVYQPPPIYTAPLQQGAPQQPQYAAPVAYPEAAIPAGMQPPAQPRERINNIFQEESKELNELLQAEERKGCWSNVVFFFTCLLIIVVSFWVSYMIGAKFFLGDRRGGETQFFSKAKQIKRLISGTQDVVRPSMRNKQNYIPAEPLTPRLPPEILNAPITVPPDTQLAESQAKKVAPKKIIKKVRPAAVKAAPVVVSGEPMYRVLVGAFDTQDQAADVIRSLKADGFPIFMYKVDGQYRIQIGSFKEKERATGLVKKAGDFGYNAYISLK